jgi:hypothetical protein
VHGALQAYWAKEVTLYRFIPAKEFADAFARSEAGAAQAKALAQPFAPSALADKGLAWTKHAVTGGALALLSHACAACRVMTLPTQSLPQI